MIPSLEVLGVKLALFAILAPSHDTLVRYACPTHRLGSAAVTAMLASIGAFQQLLPFLR